jgi:hypothetical protein
MPFAAAVPLISAGVSAAGGILANRKQKTTTQTAPTLDPAFAGLQGDLLASIRDRIANPGGGQFATLKNAAITSVNRSTQQAGRTLNSRLAARGFGGAGSDGRTGRAQVDLELDRDRQLGDLEAKFAAMLLDREDSSLGLAERLLSFGRGQSTTTTQPGNALAGGLDSGISTLTTLLSLDKLMRPAAPAAVGGYDADGGMG